MRDETAMELLPLILHQAGDLAFLAAQHRASGKFANIPFAVQPEGYSVDIGNGRCRVLGSGGLLDRAAVLSVGGHDLYLTIARYCEPYYLGDSGQVLGYRVTSNVRDLAALFVEIDVGTMRDGTPHSYQTHQEAVAALDLAVEKAGLPPPSIVINSGSGGVHAVSALDRALPPDEWLDLARRFKAALESAGLVADWQQTTMQIAAPRLPGTLNWKTGTPRPVTITRLGGDIDDTGSFSRSTDKIREIVSAYTPAMPADPTGMAGLAGLRLTEPVTPEDVAALLSVLPNAGFDYDHWVRIAYACWAVVRQSPDPDAERTVHDAFIAWSLSYTSAQRGDRGWIDPEKTWKSTRPVHKIGDATFVLLAREIGFHLPSRSAARAFDAVRQEGGGASGPAAGAVLLHRIRTHRRVALCRGRLEAERAVYRILIKEPAETVKNVLGPILVFMLTHAASEEPLIAFVDRLLGSGGAQVVSGIRAKMAASDARDAARAMSAASAGRNEQAGNDRLEGTNE